MFSSHVLGVGLSGAIFKWLGKCCPLQGFALRKLSPQVIMISFVFVQVLVPRFRKTTKTSIYPFGKALYIRRNNVFKALSANVIVPVWL